MLVALTAVKIDPLSPEEMWLPSVLAEEDRTDLRSLQYRNRRFCFQVAFEATDSSLTAQRQCPTIGDEGERVANGRILRAVPSLY